MKIHYLNSDYDRAFQEKIKSEIYYWGFVYFIKAEGTKMYLSFFAYLRCFESYNEIRINYFYPFLNT